LVFPVVLVEVHKYILIDFVAELYALVSYTVKNAYTREFTYLLEGP